MLPASFHGSYQSYKSDTSAFTTWLAEAGRACGHIFAAAGKSQAKTPIKSPKTSPKSKTKYELTSADILACAQAVVTKAKTGDQISLPDWVLKAADRAISLRKRFSTWYTDRLDSESANGSTDRHKHFTSTLEQAKAMICPLATFAATEPFLQASSPRSTPLSDQNVNIQRQHTEPLGNRFSVLKIETCNDKSKVVTSALTPPTTAGSRQRQALCEPQQSKTNDDLLLAVFCCIEDLHSLEKHVSRLWNDYSTGKVELVTAAVSTNAVFELASQLVADLEYDFPMAGHWELIYDTVSLCTNLRKKAKLASSSGCMKKSSLDWMFRDTATMLYSARALARITLGPRAGPVEQADEYSVLLLEKIYEEDKKLCGSHVDLMLMSSLATKRVLGLKAMTDFFIYSLQVQYSRDPLAVTDHLTTTLAKLLESRDDTTKLPLDAVFMVHILFNAVGTTLGTAGYQRPLAELQQRGTQIASVITKQVVKNPVRLHECKYCVSIDQALFEDGCCLADPMGSISQLRHIVKVDQVTSQTFKDYPMLNLNPVMCGVLMSHYDTLILRAGVEMSNASEAIMGLAHLYNACRATGDLEVIWPDMEACIELFEPAKVFLGAPPTDAVTFRNRYILTAGISLQAFAGNKDKCHEHEGGRKPRHWIGSERRRRLLEPNIPLSIKLSQQQSQMHAMNCLCNDVQDVVNPKSKTNAKAQRDDLTPLQYSERITNKIQTETQRSLFYVLIMNQRCTRLLQDLYKALEHPLDEDGFHIKEHGFHASIVYDILYAANYACPGCHRASGNAKILPLAAEVIEKFLKEYGADIVKSAAKKNHKKRLMSNHDWIKANGVFIDPTVRKLLNRGVGTSY